ncbi:MAG: molybdate ABC transporter substrate-binding protein [Alphaproteobacteria bacterium]|nr:molybdate ABC transporter substrate-binding protein [Alphaproteobacteria bacterium]MBO6629087.1 molybdate ABC transporter substrate-binding protein [Alphaproteobacteria bacterium]MDF1624910.1 molybdate ABC transporter substrate-binding protein [Parvibaculaceae bacterium]|tara:strand:- start:359 stop:1138 length:780 start_codon:yes stop_codon:yes gene_type:complete
MKAFTLAFLLLFVATPVMASDRPCEPITVFAAASTTDALNEIAETYERDTACSVSLVFASSGTLARQIAAGAPADLFLSANPEWVDWLTQAGHIKRHNQIPFLGNDLVLIAPASTFAPANLPENQHDRVLALVGNGRLAIGDPHFVPAGKYAATALRALGLQNLLDEKTVHAASVRDALTWVARGETTAGIVYRTDVMIEPRVQIIINLPLPPGSEIIYPLALIGRSPHPAAQTFFDYLQTYEAVAILANHGFRRVSAE